MLRPRIIPCLLLSNGGLVKTTEFLSPRYIGDPINTVRIFNEKEVDELIILDIDATSQSRDPDYVLLENIALECRMPLCYGGGIKKIEQIRKIISLGVEKVALSSIAHSAPLLIEHAVREFGSQSIVVIIDVKVNPLNGTYEVYVNNGRISTGQSPAEFASRMAALGAGEIVINSITLDGTMTGYDLRLASLVKDRIGVPLTILGGAGSLEDIKKLFSECGVVGAAAGSLFVYKGSLRAVLINYPTMVQRDNLIKDTFSHR